MKRSWLWALLGGAMGAGLVTGTLAWRKHRELSLRAAGMQRALQLEGDQLAAYLLSKGAAIEPEIRALALAASERSATFHLATVYGLTPELVAQLQNLPRLPA